MVHHYTCYSLHRSHYTRSHWLTRVFVKSLSSVLSAVKRTLNFLHFFFSDSVSPVRSVFPVVHVSEPRLFLTSVNSLSFPCLHRSVTIRTPHPTPYSVSSGTFLVNLPVPVPTSIIRFTLPLVGFSNSWLYSDKVMENFSNVTGIPVGWWVTLPFQTLTLSTVPSLLSSWVTSETYWPVIKVLVQLSVHTHQVPIVLHPCPFHLLFSSSGLSWSVSHH